MSDLAKKSRWVGEAIAPAKSMLSRSLNDLPSDVTPGAKQVAMLTAWRTAQADAIERVTAALDMLETLPDWSGGFLVCDAINFDWRTAPFKRYASFTDFFDTELRDTWEAWDAIHHRFLD